MKKTFNYIEVTKNDLPLVCPTNMTSWNMHPKVYLPVQQAGLVICPYCKIHYKFVDGEVITEE